jgi:hypothetical protein
MARVSANEPCKCPDEHKRDIHLQTVGGHHRPAVYCTKCGHITPKSAGAYTTRNEKPDAIELLEHANALNEANAAALQRLLDKTVETLEESVERLRAKVKRNPELYPLLLDAEEQLELERGTQQLNAFGEPFKTD